MYCVGVQVSVYYIGTLAKSNKRFDSCQKGKPFRFRLGRGEVIKGWDTGLIGEAPPPGLGPSTQYSTVLLAPWYTV